MPKRTYEDDNGRVCPTCLDYKPWIDPLTNKPNFGPRSSANRRCHKCSRAIATIKRRTQQGLINDPSFPLDRSIRLARWVCKIHPEKGNVYFNQRGHRVCRTCHFASIVKATRERRRRNNPQWARDGKLWTDEHRRQHTLKRAKTAKRKLRLAKSLAKDNLSNRSEDS